MGLFGVETDLDTEVLQVTVTDGEEDSMVMDGAVASGHHGDMVFIEGLIARSLVTTDLVMLIIVLFSITGITLIIITMEILEETLEEV